LNEARAAIDKGNYRKAILLLDKAIAKKKFFREAYTEKAYCYSSLDNDDSAIIVYNELLAFNPNNTLALHNSGLCSRRLQKFDQAIDYFNRALISKGYNPDDSVKSQIYTEEYTPAGKEILGIDDRFDVSFAEIFYYEGLAHYRAGHLRKAYTYFTKCTSRGFNTGESYYMIGLCWLRSDNKEKACEAFRNSLFAGYESAKGDLDSICGLPAFSPAIPVR